MEWQTAVARLLDSLLLPTGAPGSQVLPGWTAPGQERLGTAGAARLILPALESLSDLREALEARGHAWDGLLHRSMSLRPARSADGDGAPLRLRTLERGGWEMLTATMHTGPWEVRHELAFRPPGAARQEGSTSRMADGGISPARGEAQGNPGLVSGGSREPGAPVEQNSFARLSRVTIADWASATGDCNALHLVPGAALRAGLGTEEGSVIAHGTLLAALALTQIAEPAAGFSVRFLAPCQVTATPVMLSTAAGGALRAGGITVARLRCSCDEA